MGNWITKTLEQSLKEERKKTIKEVIEYVESVEISGSTYWTGLIKKHFLPPDPVEELANELITNVDVNDGCSHEIAKYILEKYELKKKE